MCVELGVDMIEAIAWVWNSDDDDDDDDADYDDLDDDDLDDDDEFASRWKGEGALYLVNQTSSLYLLVLPVSLSRFTQSLIYMDWAFFSLLAQLDESFF